MITSATVLMGSKKFFATDAVNVRITVRPTSTSGSSGWYPIGDTLLVAEILPR